MSSTLLVVYGAKGWIGQQFCAYVSSTQPDITLHFPSVRPEKYEESYDEILKIKMEHLEKQIAVISFIGRTYGYDAETNTHIPTIDYLERPGKLVENMRDNFVAPVNLAQICTKLNLHYIYLGTGCIYTYTDTHRIFTEEDEPNFFGSGYSIVKGYTNQEMHKYASHTLQLRIRMPISKHASSRNLIDKLVSYKNICSIPNSMTVLDDMWPIIVQFIRVRETGTYNLCNPGTAEHRWILEQYRDCCDPTHTWTDVSYDEQMKYIKAHRSNNEMSTEKLELFCSQHNLQLDDIQTSIRRCIENRC
jgi:dTDP-4-dehydrorhamnose reductase